MRIWPETKAVRPGPAATLNLGQVPGALSHALDLTEGQPKGHWVRSCWIGARIAREMRLILTVSDIFDALTAERPYREAMPLEKTYAIMDDMVRTVIDPAC
jgi:hypothetical protein